MINIKMKKGYKSESHKSLSNFQKVILVSNYEYLNKIVNLPVLENSSLVNEFKYDYVNIGMWKIKK